MAPQPASNGVPDLCVFHPHSAGLLVKGAGRVACRAVPVSMGSGKQVAEDLGVAGPLGGVGVGVGGVGWWRVCKLEGTVGTCVAVTTCAGGLDRDGRVKTAGADPAEEEEEEACEEGDTGWRRLVRWSFSSEKVGRTDAAHSDAGFCTRLDSNFGGGGAIGGLSTLGISTGSCADGADGGDRADGGEECCFTEQREVVWTGWGGGGGVLDRPRSGE